MDLPAVSILAYLATTINYSCKVILLLGRFAIEFLIPDVSKRVKDAMDRDDFILKNKNKPKLD
jgi:hypothetical protein